MSSQRRISRVSDIVYDSSCYLWILFINKSDLSLFMWSIDCLFIWYVLFKVVCLPDCLSAWLIDQYKMILFSWFKQFKQAVHTLACGVCVKQVGKSEFEWCTVCGHILLIRSSVTIFSIENGDKSHGADRKPITHLLSNYYVVIHCRAAIYTCFALPKS